MQFFVGSDIDVPLSNALMILLHGKSLWSCIPEGAVPDLHYCAPFLGMFPALLDLAAAGSVPPLTVPVHQSQTQHQLPYHVSDILQQLHQPFSVHAAHQELQGVPEEAQAVLVSWQLLQQEESLSALTTQVTVFQQSAVHRELYANAHSLAAST